MDLNLAHVAVGPTLKLYSRFIFINVNIFFAAHFLLYYIKTVTTSVSIKIIKYAYIILQVIYISFHILNTQYDVSKPNSIHYFHLTFFAIMRLLIF